MPLEDRGLGLRAGGWEWGLALQIPCNAEPGASSPVLLCPGKVVDTRYRVCVGVCCPSGRWHKQLSPLRPR